MPRRALIEKHVGETPLEALERYRRDHPELMNISAEDFWMKVPLLHALKRRSRIWLYGNELHVPKQRHIRQKYPPMAYAGRLDPMASGKLLILIGDECKKQKKYHALDKQYEFSVLFGISSDTGDVLGRLQYEDNAPQVGEADLRRIVKNLTGPITLPYPHFSSKTVKGKPLHMWTLENRLDEIEIPTYTANIFKLKLKSVDQKTGKQITKEALAKINTIPPVTDERKALGNDFRRVDVRKDWNEFQELHGSDTYTIATFICTCSSGLYMRTLAEVIAKHAHSTGLSYHIHRTKIGHHVPFIGILPIK